MKDIVRQIAVVLSTIAVIVVNGLAVSLPLNNLDTGEISDRFDVYFVPAGYVFSIWGLIYLALIAYSVYQLFPAQRENPRLQATGWLYVLSCAANIAWLFLWHYLYFELTIVVMLALLAFLIAIYVRLGTGRIRVPSGETWLVQVPFSIYLGWITVATVANATALLDYLRWDGWGIAAIVWGVVMMVVATLLAAVVSVLRGDIAYVLVIAWALIGIAVKHSDTPLIAYSALGLAVVAVLTLLAGVPLRRQRMRVLIEQPQSAAAADPW